MEHKGIARALLIVVLGIVAVVGVSTPAVASQRTCATATDALRDASKRFSKANDRVLKKTRKVAKAKDAKRAAEGKSERKKAKKELRRAKEQLREAKAAVERAAEKLRAAQDNAQFECEEPDPGGVYVALGDSATSGYVAGVSEHFDQTVGINRTEDVSQGGATSGSLRTGGQLAEALGVINGGTDTRAVTINIGGNDALGGCDYATDSCGFRANFDAILTELDTALADDPGSEFLVAMAYYNPANGTANEADYDDRLLGDDLLLACEPADPAGLGLNDVIAEVTEHHDGLLADPYDAFKTAGQSFMADSLHPNAEGYAAIVEAFEGASAPCPPT